jgi:hypothetical protein
MAHKITVKDLRDSLAVLNAEFAREGSNYYLVEQGRNGYQAVDVYYTDVHGRGHCMRNLQGGTSRECINEAAFFARKYAGELSYGVEVRNRVMAKAVLSRLIDFNADFHTLDSWSVEGLAVWAKLTKYRKPENANGSTARYFFQHLVKKVTI